MATLATDLSARLWSGGTCTRWTVIRGFAKSTHLKVLLLQVSQREASRTRLWLASGQACRDRHPSTSRRSPGRRGGRLQCRVVLRELAPGQAQRADNKTKMATARG